MMYACANACEPQDWIAMNRSIDVRRKMVAVISVASLWFAVLLGTNVTAAAQPLKLKIGDTTSLAQLGMYVAIQKGIFQKHGLDVERIAMPGGAKVLTTLLTGDIDVAFLATSTALLAQFENRPVKIIGMSHNMEIYSLLGRNDLKGQVTKPADLKDRTIGISSIGSGSWAFAKFLARLGSLDDTRDVKIVPLGNMMAIIAALKTNRVDTVTLWEPGITMALAENAGYSVVDLVDPAQHQQYVKSAESMVEVILAKEDIITGQPEKMRKLFAALNESYAWIHNTPVDEVAKAVAPIVGEANLKVLADALKRNLPVVPKIATVDEKMFTSTMARMVDTGLFKEAMPFAKSVDNRYGAVK
jgi:NitT/TauT family transport system substrate-binding protein